MAKLNSSRIVNEVKMKENKEAKSLDDVRHEVSSLRLSNKELAKQLHNDKYVAKHQTQREVNSLRSENLRIQREISALKDNISITTRQAEAREHVARGKQREIKEAEDERDKIRTKIRNVQTKHDELSKSQAVLMKEIAEMKRSIQRASDERKDLSLQIDDEVGLRKELESANQQISSDCEKLQTRIGSRQNESQTMEKNNEALAVEIVGREEEIGSVSRGIADNEKICRKLEADTEKVELECLDKNERLLADKSRHDSLKSTLKPVPTCNAKVQTEPLMLGKGNNIFDRGPDSHTDRGTIVRVVSVGGSSKQKFGKDMEVRATSYSRHVQLNVKLNK